MRVGVEQSTFGRFETVEEKSRFEWENVHRLTSISPAEYKSAFVPHSRSHPPACEYQEKVVTSLMAHARFANADSSSYTTLHPVPIPQEITNNDQLQRLSTPPAIMSFPYDVSVIMMNAKRKARSRTPLGIGLARDVPADGNCIFR